MGTCGVDEVSLHVHRRASVGGCTDPRRVVRVIAGTGVRGRRIAVVGRSCADRFPISVVDVRVGVVLVA